MFKVTNPEAFPAFKRPPVVEVALSVAFDPILDLTVPQIGLLWNQEFRSTFPTVQEQMPVQPVVERFGAAPQPFGISFQALEGPPTPRLWFVTPDGSELLQIQRDWFAHNWRRTKPSDPYPHYAHVRGTFDHEFERFQAFVRDAKLGDVSPRQFEVTYVNHLLVGELMPNVGAVHQMVDLIQAPESFLGNAEEVALDASFLMRGEDQVPFGRLRVSLKPVFDVLQQQQMVVLTLTARGMLPSGDLFEFLDIGHEWVVRGFTAVTTPEAHQTWGRSA